MCQLAHYLFLFINNDENYNGKKKEGKHLLTPELECLRIGSLNHAQRKTCEAAGEFTFA
jgi:hypothetical protein